MATEELEDIRQQVQPIVEQIPRGLVGIERHEAIGNLVEELDEDTRMQLRGELEKYLKMMEKLEASDIDLGGSGCAGYIWYRMHGKKKPLKDGPQLSLAETDVLCHNLIMKSQREHLLEHRNLDFSHQVPLDDKDNVQRFRANMYFDLEHLALNMRGISTEIRPFKGLGLHPEVAKALSLKYLKFGMTLVTGITGSGKSATLDTIIDANNRSVDSHIVIVSSPVEMVHKPIRSIMRHREVGRDTSSFKRGTVEALRQDPDIIMIGELRDSETIMSALEVTDSGHKTFSTLHTSSARESIDRIIGEVPPEEQERVRNRLADVLTCVISQKLVPTIDGKRVLAKEVLLSTHSVKAAIRNNNTDEIYQMLMEGGKMGMHTLEQDLKRLYESGKISYDEAINQANNKKRLKDIMG